MLDSLSGLGVPRARHYHSNTGMAAPQLVSPHGDCHGRSLTDLAGGHPLLQLVAPSLPERGHLPSCTSTSQYSECLGLGVSLAHAGSPETTEIHPGATIPSTFRPHVGDGYRSVRSCDLLNRQLFNNSATDNVTGNNTIGGGALPDQAALRLSYKIPPRHHSEWHRADLTVK